MESKTAVPPRVYRIEIVVGDENVDSDRLRTLISKAGDVREIKMIGFPTPKYAY